MHHIPEGFSAITPNFVFENAAKAIELYKKVFNASENFRSLQPNSDKITHADLIIEGAHIFVSDSFPHINALPNRQSVYLYVPDADKTYATAIQNGFKGLMEPTDMFWGDRMSKLLDPFGHSWTVATLKRKPTEEEIKKGAAEFEF